MAFRLFALLVLVCGSTKAFTQFVCYQFSGTSENGGVPYVATINITHIPPSTSSSAPGFIYGASFNGSALPIPADDVSLQDVVTVSSGSTTLTFQVFSITILYNAYGDGKTQFQLGGRGFTGIFPTGSVSINLSGNGNLLPNGLVPTLPSTPQLSGYLNASLTGGPEQGGQITSIGSCGPPDCQLPTAETTAFNGWGVAGYAPYDALGRWKQTIIGPSGVSFSGRSIKETPSGVGADSCYFDGSIFSPFTSVTNSLTSTQWTVNPDNTWGDDFVGWANMDPTKNPITYYRLKGRAPCGAAYLQQMTMSCPDGSFQNYGPVNVLAPSFTANTATSVRACGKATSFY